MKYLKGDKPLVAKYHNGTKIVNAIYHGLYLVWTKVSSCFGSGGWRNDLGWKNDEGWSNNG